MRGTNSSTSRPASTPYWTYSIPSRSVNASSCSAVAPGLADVVAAHRDRVPARHFAGAEREDVGDEPHRRPRRVDVLLLGDELLQDVVLNGPRDSLPVGALPLGHDQVHGEDHRRRRVDRHRRRDVGERNALEQRLHVGQRRDRDTALADFPERQRVVRVAPHQRRQVEGDAQPGAPVAPAVPCSGRWCPPASRTPRTAASSRSCRGSRSGGCRACTESPRGRSGRGCSRSRRCPLACTAA